MTGLFVGLHVAIAGATHTPELMMDMDEGKQFMTSAQNVMRHYSVESTQKTLDWVSFAGTCCMIYGTRFGSYMLRKRTEKTEQARPGATVYQMPQRAASAPNAQPEPQQAPSHVAVEMDFESE